MVGQQSFKYSTEVNERVLCEKSNPHQITHCTDQLHRMFTFRVRLHEVRSVWNVYCYYVIQQLEKCVESWKCDIFHLCTFIYLSKYFLLSELPIAKKGFYKSYSHKHLQTIVT